MSANLRTTANNHSLQGHGHSKRSIGHCGQGGGHSTLVKCHCGQGGEHSLHSGSHSFQGGDHSTQGRNCCFLAVCFLLLSPSFG
jgi:hypothetical protein